MKKIGIVTLSALIITANAETSNKPKYREIKAKDLLEIIATHDITRVEIPPNVSSEGWQLHYGHIHYEGKKIVLNKLVKEEHMMETFLHEMYHRDFHKQGYNEAHDEKLIGEYAQKTYKKITGKKYTEPTTIAEALK